MILRTFLFPRCWKCGQCQYWAGGQLGRRSAQQRFRKHSWSCIALLFRPSFRDGAWRRHWCYTTSWLPLVRGFRHRWAGCVPSRDCFCRFSSCCPTSMAGFAQTASSKYEYEATSCRGAKKKKRKDMRRALHLEASTGTSIAAKRTITRKPGEQVVPIQSIASWHTCTHQPRTCF